MPTTANPTSDRALTAAGTARREAILDAAMHRFLGQGVRETTLEQIGRDSGSSTGSIYHQFPSKEALAGAVYADCMERYQEAFLSELEVNESAEDGIKAVVRFHLEWCRKRPEMARFLFTVRDPEILSAVQARLDELNGRFQAGIGSWWKAHAHYGALRRLTPMQSAALWLGPAHELARFWLAGHGEAPTDADIETLAEAAWLCVRESG